MTFFLYLSAGFLVGLYGTMIGAGGGFVLVPFLLFLYPAKNTDFITGVSLAVVFFNALSGTIAYTRMRRVHYRSGLIFTSTAIPGAIIGAYSSSLIPRKIFDPLFGVLLIIAALFLIIKPDYKGHEARCSPRFLMACQLTEKNGKTYCFSYNTLLGMTLSFLVGFVSSLFGIGGGIIHVPILIYLLNFPTHIATATSHFILAVTTGTATLVHAFSGTLKEGIHLIIPLALGTFLGAPLGAMVSSRIKSRNIIRALAVALIFVGIRTIVGAI